VPPLTLAYLITGTPRTGGNFLTALLTERGLGQPDEYLRLRDRLIHKWKIRPTEFFPALWKRQSSNGIFGMKVHWGEVILLDIDPTDLLPPGPRWRFVHMYREDLSAQAISWKTAVTTGDWFTPQRPKIQATGEEIEYTRTEILRSEWRWATWYDQQGLQPLVVRFEDLVAHPEDTADQVVRYLSTP